MAVTPVKRKQQTQAEEDQVSKAVAEFADAVSEEELREDLKLVNREVSMDKIISTGSTLLDLAISGKRRRGGGLPGGIIVETFGGPSLGKTALLAEECGSVQSQGGDAQFADPEARLDEEYTKIYGVSLKDHFMYFRPDTVTELFSKFYTWKPKNPNVINAMFGDSLAALSTDLELDNDEGDKMGMRRAKEFSQELRKTCRIIAKNNWLVSLSNQVRQGQMSVTTPGGFAIPFYASLRIHVEKPRDHKIFKTAKIANKEVKKVIGINSICTIVKSSIDEPYRRVPICITFNYGVDDIRANLQYMKDFTGCTVYDCLDGKTYQSIENAIQYIEKTSLEKKLKEQTIDLWEDIEKKLHVERKPKQR
jgi:RecA/RadA recombinase